MAPVNTVKKKRLRACRLLLVVVNVEHDIHVWVPPNRRGKQILGGWVGGGESQVQYEVIVMGLENSFPQ